MQLLLRAEIKSVFLNDKQILRNIFLNCCRGERIWIRGSNGVGKTTLLQCLNGMIDYSGSIDKSVNTFYIDPSGFFYPFLTACENAHLFDLPLRSEIALNYDKLFSDYSSGEKLFLQLQGLLQRPEFILLIDDCFGYFDDQFLRMILDSLIDNNSTIIFTSQDTRVKGAQTKALEIKNGTLVETV